MNESTSQMSVATVSGCYNVTTTYVTTETFSATTVSASASVETITGTTIQGTTGSYVITGGTYGCYVITGTTYYITESGYTLNGTTITIPFGYTETQNASTVTETITETYQTSG